MVASEGEGAWKSYVEGHYAKLFFVVISLHMCWNHYMVRKMLFQSFPLRVASLYGESMTCIN